MQVLPQADARFVARRERVCRWWLLYLLAGIVALLAAAGSALQAVPQLADPIGTLQAAVLGQLDAATAQKLAAFGIVSTIAAVMAAAGAILVSLARRATERRWLRIVRQLQ